MADEKQNIQIEIVEEPQVQVIEAPKGLLDNKPAEKVEIETAEQPEIEAAEEEQSVSEKTLANREKRQKTKERRRYMIEQSEQERIHLRATVNALTQKLQAMESQMSRHISATNEAIVDDRIASVSGQINALKGAIKTAAATGDGETLAEANEELLNAHSLLNELHSHKQQFRQAPEQAQQVNAQQQAQQHVQKLRGLFYQRNPWVQQADPATVQQILAYDREIAARGYNSIRGEYWEMLESTLRAAYPQHYQAADEADEDDEAPQMTTTNKKVPVASANGAKASSGRNVIKLDAGQRKALESYNKNDPKYAQLLAEFRAYNDRTKRFG